MYFDLNKYITDENKREFLSEHDSQRGMNFPVLPKEPGIYRLVKVRNKLEIVYESNIIKTEELILGNIGERVLREWNRFCTTDESVGSLNYGDKGSGKTSKCDLLANIAVIKGNLPVLKVVGFSVNEHEVQFFQTLNNCCLYLDEFGKHFNSNIQQKMLNLLTDTSKKFLILFTENEKYAINNYILGRTQRARYRQEFTKLSKEVITDYLSLFNVRKDFKEELLGRYEKVLTFSFDNLKALVSEHLEYPNDSIDNLLEYLNVNDISKDSKYRFVKAELIKENEPNEDITKELNLYNGDETTKAQILSGNTYINFEYKGSTKYWTIKSSDIESVVDNVIKLKKENILFTYIDK